MPQPRWRSSHVESGTRALRRQAALNTGSSERRCRLSAGDDGSATPDLASTAPSTAATTIRSHVGHLKVEEQPRHFGVSAFCPMKAIRATATSAALMTLASPVDSFSFLRRVARRPVLPPGPSAEASVDDACEHWSSESAHQRIHLGLIGEALGSRVSCPRGHEPVRLVRSHRPDDLPSATWNPAVGTMDDDELLDGIDAVIHLAGEGIAERRWSDEQKARILDSRVVEPPLADRIAAATTPPSVFLSGGDRLLRRPGRRVAHGKQRTG